MTPRAKPAAALRRTRAAPLAERSPVLGEDSWSLLDEARLSRELGFVMRMAQLVLFEDLSTRLGGVKLTLSQFSVMRLIRARPGLTQQRIGDALRIKKPNLVTLLDTLELRGLVSRASSATDRRAYALFLTPKGERTLTKAMEGVAAHLKLIHTLLDADDLERVIAVLRTIATAFPGAQA